MTTFNIEDKPGTWFDMEGGGRLQLRTMMLDDWKAIRKQTVKKRVDFKKVDGTPGRFEFEETDEDLQNELFWDRVIVNWEHFFDSKKKPIPCTKENKVLLMTRSAKFAKVMLESLKTLAEDQEVEAEAAEKN